MRQLYDAERKALVFSGPAAGESFWTEHWKSHASQGKKTRDRMLSRLTAKHVPAGGLVLEGGCGTADNVKILGDDGYLAVGLDFSGETLAKRLKEDQGLNLVAGDVNALPFKDGSFDACWSIGVVEHFQDGYGLAIKEAGRILKPDGILFLSVPAMSPLRRLKAWAGLYPRYDGALPEGDSFYQYAFDPALFNASVESMGFKRLETSGVGGFKGLKDESGPFKEPLQAIYDGRSIAMRALKAAIERAFRPIACHMLLSVFKKV